MILRCDGICCCIPGSRPHLASLLSPVLEAGPMVLKREGAISLERTGSRLPSYSRHQYNMPTLGTADTLSTGILSLGRG